MCHIHAPGIFDSPRRAPNPLLYCSYLCPSRFLHLHYQTVLRRHGKQTQVYENFETQFQRLKSSKHFTAYQTSLKTLTADHQAETQFINDVITKNKIEAPELIENLLIIYVIFLFWATGQLDEKENDLLTVVLEERMKRLWNCPSYIAQTAPKLLLASLNRLYGHEEHFSFLQFEANDVLASVGDAPKESIQRAASVICETEGVSAYYIPASVMQEAMETFTDHFNFLEESYFRACGMRRAANYPTTLSSYHNMPTEKLEMLLERSCVPIGPDFDTIKIPPHVQEVVVIEGMVKIAETFEIYIAPAVMSRMCTKNAYQSKNHESSVGIPSRGSSARRI
ncbi:unnamed protein product [Orchesella dallaii]|uniref:Uncharacterized protein n=1 Tax=Orchesella dallaii TaxID=48710 RepID=A0ABP1QB10_9HEXA